MKRGKPSPPVRKTTKARTKPGFLFHVSAVGRRKAGTALEEGACDFQTHVARNCRAGDDPSKIAKDFGWMEVASKYTARVFQHRSPSYRHIRIYGQSFPLQKRGKQPTNQEHDNKGVQGLSQTQRRPSGALSRNAKAPSSGGAVNIRTREAKSWMYGEERQDAATTGSQCSGAIPNAAQAERHAFAERKSAVVRRRCQYQGKRRKVADVWEWRQDAATTGRPMFRDYLKRSVGPSDTLSRNAKAPSSGGAVNIRMREAKSWMYGNGDRTRRQREGQAFRDYLKRSVGPSDMLLR